MLAIINPKPLRQTLFGAGQQDEIEGFAEYRQRASNIDRMGDPSSRPERHADCSQLIARKRARDPIGNAPEEFLEKRIKIGIAADRLASGSGAKGL